MDVSRLAEPDYNVEDWINTTLDGYQNSDGSLETYTANLVTKLQINIQEINKSLDDISQQVVANMPRVLWDMDTMRKEATLLQDQTRKLKQDMEKMEITSSKFVTGIIELDLAKSHMQEVYDALQEANNWSALVSERQTVMESTDMTKVSSYLSKLQSCLSVMRDAPDYDEKASMVNAVRTYLDSLVSTKLAASLQNHAVDEASNCIGILLSVGEAEKVKLQYISCHKASLISMYQDTFKPDSDFTGKLATFFHSLLMFWDREVTWLVQVFPDPAALVLPLLCTFFTAVHQNLHGSVKRYIQQDHTSIENILSLKKLLQRFLEDIGRSPACCSKPVARLNSQLFMEALLRPFSPITESFHSKQLRELETVLLPLDSISVTSVPLLLEVFMEVSDWLVAATTQAFNLTMELSGGYALPTLFDVLKAFMLIWRSRMSSCMGETGASRSPVSIAGSLRDMDDIWTPFHACFQLLERLGGFKMRLIETFEEMMRRLLDSGLTAVDPAALKEAPTLGVVPLWLFLTSTKDISVWKELCHVTRGRDLPSELSSCLTDVDQVISELHQRAYNILLMQAKRQLDVMATMEFWRRTSKDVTMSAPGELPDFSLFPKPYISSVGEFLLTLPQQLEPCLGSTPSQKLSEALRCCQLPHEPSAYAAVDGSHLISAETSFLDAKWLHSLSLSIMDHYKSNILGLPELNHLAVKQLVVDIDYYLYVMDAVGSSPTDDFLQVYHQLKSSYLGSSEKSAEVRASSSGVEPKKV